MPRNIKKSPHPIGHPAAGDKNINHFHLLLGLFGAPLAWAAQMYLSEILSSYSCYPHRVPLAKPIWNHSTLMLVCISVACLLAGIASVAAAFASWRQSKDEMAKKQHHHIIEVGEGRTKFLAMLAILSSLLFLVAIAFTGCALVLVSPCGG